MDKIKKFTKDNLGYLREELNHALERVGREYGIAFEVGNIKYAPDTFHTKITAIIVNGEADNKEDIDKTKFEKDANQHGIFYGFTKEDYRKKFTYGGRDFELVGFNAKAKKYPFIGEGKDGKRYKFPKTIIK